MRQTLGSPGPPAGGAALTKQLSMEQETRAVRLMVTGGLGQRTCPRSRCAARQSRAPAASRLRGRPGAAAAARRRARAAGPRAPPARRSPRLHNGASPAPPSGTSAEGRGAGLREHPDRAARAGKSGGGADPQGPAHSPRLLPPKPPAPPQPRAPTRDSSGLPGIWAARRRPLHTTREGRARPPTSFHFPSSHVSHPTPLFSHIRPDALPSFDFPQDGAHLPPPQALSSFKASSFPSKSTVHHSPVHQCPPIPDLTNSIPFLPLKMDAGLGQFGHSTLLKGKFSGFFYFKAPAQPYSFISTSPLVSHPLSSG